MFTKKALCESVNQSSHQHLILLIFLDFLFVLGVHSYEFSVSIVVEWVILWLYYTIAILVDYSPEGIGCHEYSIVSFEGSYTIYLLSVNLIEIFDNSSICVNDSHRLILGCNKGFAIAKTWCMGIVATDFLGLLRCIIPLFLSKRKTSWWALLP